MNLSQVKAHLSGLDQLIFTLPAGQEVPHHFHVTEVGMVTRHFIDCGGTMCKEEMINFQLWQDSDVDHRLRPDKLVKIIELSEKTLGLADLPVEVEYQGETIGRYGIQTAENGFVLEPLFTDCLAKDVCLPRPQTQAVSEGCTPGGGCC